VVLDFFKKRQKYVLEGLGQYSEREMSTSRTTWAKTRSKEARARIIAGGSYTRKRLTAAVAASIEGP
jgi:hypothetical protein